MPETNQIQVKRQPLMSPPRRQPRKGLLKPGERKLRALAILILRERHDEKISMPPFFFFLLDNTAKQAGKSGMHRRAAHSYSKCEAQHGCQLRTHNAWLQSQPNTPPNGSPLTRKGM